MIIEASSNRGADAIVVGCPLCFFNLDYRQKNVEMETRGFTKIPVLYFTQLLAIALGLDAEVCDFDLNYIDPRPLLEKKGLIKKGKWRKKDAPEPLIWQFSIIYDNLMIIHWNTD